MWPMLSSFSPALRQLSKPTVWHFSTGYWGFCTALGFNDFKESTGKAWLRQTAHLRAEFLVIALGVPVQALGVMQQLLDLPHLPLAAPQLALQLLHLPP